jgi:hypothetical protein
MYWPNNTSDASFGDDSNNRTLTCLTGLYVVIIQVRYTSLMSSKSH